MSGNATRCKPSRCERNESLRDYESEFLLSTDNAVLYPASDAARLEAEQPREEEDTGNL